MPQISERRATAALAIAVVLLSIYLLWLTTGFPPGRGEPGPAVWPRIVLVMVLLASAYLVTMARRRADEKKIDARRLRLPGVILTLAILYIVALQYAFFVSTALFLFACMMILRVWSWPILFGVSIGFPLVVYLVFVRVLHLTFPTLLGMFGG